MMTYNDSITMLKDSVLAKYRQKNRLANFSIAIANLFVLGYTVTKQFIVNLCLVTDKYSILLRDKERTTEIMRTTKDDRKHNLASVHLDSIEKQIDELMRTNRATTIREYNRTIQNINKLWNSYNNNRLFGIKQPIQYNKHKLSNYARYYNNSFITKYLNNSDTIIELQQKIKQIPNFLEEHKQLWLSYYNNHKNRFYYTMPFGVDNKTKIDSMTIEDINLRLEERGIITA